MPIAGACVILLVVGTLLAWGGIPLPLHDPLFAWLRRQWVMEAITILTSLAIVGVVWSSWRQRALPKIPWWSAWCVWIGWAACSLAYSIDRGTSLRSWLAMVSYGLLAYAMSRLVKSDRDLLIWTRFLVGSAVIASLEGLFQYCGAFDAALALMDDPRVIGGLDLQGWGAGAIRDFLVRKRIFSVFGWPNLFAGFLLVMIPLGLGLAAQTRTLRGRIGWGVVSGWLGLCLILTLSMGAWMAAILIGSVSWWLLRPAGVASEGARPQRWTNLARVLTVGGVACGIVLVTSLIVAKRAKPMIVASIGSRLAYAQGAWNIIRAHPVTGTGLGTFGLAYRSFRPSEAVEGRHAALHAHSTLLEIWAELGLLGLGCFVAILWKIGQLLTASARDRPVAGIRAIRIGLAVGILGFFIHSLLEQTFFEASTAPFWWLALGLLTGAMGVEQPGQAMVRRVDHARFIYAPLSLGCLGLVVVIRLGLADLWAAQGVFHSLADRPQDAIGAFARAQRWDPLASRYPLEQGERFLSLASREASEQAQEQFQRAVTLSPWMGYAWLRLGLASWQLEQTDRAIVAMQQAGIRAPNSRKTLVHLARMLCATRRFEDLKQVARRFQQLEPSSSLGYCWEATARQELSAR